MDKNNIRELLELLKFKQEGNIYIPKGILMHSLL